MGEPITIGMVLGFLGIAAVVVVVGAVIVAILAAIGAGYSM